LKIKALLMHTIINDDLRMNIALALTRNGRKIEKIKVDRRQFEGQLIKIIPTGILPVAFTKEHEILTVNRKYIHGLSPKTNRDTTYAVFSKPRWKKAKDFEKGDFVVIPRIKPEPRLKKIVSIKRFFKRKWNKITKIPLNKETAELFGLYVAEGHAKTQVHLEFGKHEKKLANRACQLIKKNFGYSTNFHNIKKSGFQIRFGGSPIARAFREWFGVHAINKRMPNFILYHKNPDILQSFLIGYYKGDGSSGQTSKADMSTVSPWLALQIQQAVTRWGLFININRNIIRPSKINGRKITTNNPEYSVHSRVPEVIKIFRKIPVKRKRYTKFFWSTNEYVFVRVRKVENVPYQGTIYRFSSNCQSYTISNFLVHS